MLHALGHLETRDVVVCQEGLCWPPLRLNPRHGRSHYFDCVPKIYVKVACEFSSFLTCRNRRDGRVMLLALGS